MNKFKLNEIPGIFTTGNKFLKWTETFTTPQQVFLKIDENGFILFWRDVNKKADYLDIACIRDVRIGKNANLPKDKSARDILFNGQSNSSIEDKTMSIFYAYDFVNIQCVNFVSMSIDADRVVKEWSQFLFECTLNPKIYNLSPWEQLDKLRVILLYGKSVLDEKTKQFVLPVQTIVDSFVTTEKQYIESERQHIYHMLQSVGLPCGKNDFLDSSTLTQDYFFQFYLRLVSKEDIEKIFSEYNSNDDGTKKKLCMNAQQFQNFFNEKQRDPRLNELLYPYYTADKATEMINKFETDEAFRKKKQLSPQGLMRYLMDAENEIIDPIKYCLYEDMTQPLSHYFVNSSHNTYLSGHQITGESQVEMYRQVLLSGCRCVELDCWDDKNLDEPVVTHGHTLCTQILFKDVVEAIRDCAFKTSPYPVILSFENHCSKVMQQKMAKYLVDILGDYLLIAPLPQYPLNPGVKLPSPEDLKYKILIKNKKTDIEKLTRNQTSKKNFESLNNTENTNNNDQTSSNNNSSISAAIAATATFAAVTEEIYVANDNDSSLLINSNSNNNSNSKDSIKKSGYSKSNKFDVISPIDQNDEEKYEDSDGDEEKAGATNGPENIITAKEMSNLVNYLQPIDFHSFEMAEKKNRSFELSSFLETKAYNLHKEHSIEFINYNKRQFSRIYPKSTRIASDNFIPQVFWNVGCQLVALNFQTLDVGMRLNIGKFEYNDRSGYLLKPDALRRVDVNKSFDPFAESPLDGIVAATVNVQVISGIFFNDKHEKRLGYTILVEMFGLPADTLKGQKAYRAKLASNNTFNVIYGESVFTFKKIIMPPLAMLCFTAFDEQNRFIGYRLLPIIGLRSGYRYITLKNESNQSLNMCMLFVNIAVKDYVPNKFAALADALVDPIRYISNLEKREEMLKSLTDENEVFGKEIPSDNEISRKDKDFLTNLNSSSNQISNSSSSSIRNIAGSQTNNNNNNICIQGNNNNNNLASSTQKLTNFQSADKFNWNSNISSNYAQSFASSSSTLEIKRKSQTDIYSTSMNHLNVGRSCSMSNNELQSFDMKRNGFINSSRLNDANLFTEIDINRLRTNKVYARLEETYTKKINRLEKDAEKRVADLGQLLTTESDKTLSEAQKLKQKYEKELIKAEKQANQRINSANPDTESYLISLRINYVSQIESIDSEAYEKIRKLHEKRVNEMDSIYYDTYKEIKMIQMNSLEPLCNRLEKLIMTIQERRMTELKLMIDKQISEVNRQVHQQIKNKKKIASKSSQDKHEYQRLSREIEKDSVSIAVTENSKMRELLRSKQKLLQQVIEKSFGYLKDFKNQQTKTYEEEFSKKYENKKKIIHEQYQINTFLTTTLK